MTKAAPDNVSDIAAEALHLALIQIAKDCKKQFEAELDLFRAERRAIVAEIRSDLAEFKVAALQAKGTAGKVKTRP